MLLLHALKNLISSISCTKKINVGIELVMFVSLTEITADQTKLKKKWKTPAPPPKQTGQRLFPSKRSHANSIYSNRLLAKYQIHSWLRRLSGLMNY